MSSHLIYMSGMVANLSCISFIAPLGHQDTRSIIVTCGPSCTGMKRNESMVTVTVIRDDQLLPGPEVMETCQLCHVST